MGLSKVEQWLGVVVTGLAATLFFVYLGFFARGLFPSAATGVLVGLALGGVTALGFALWARRCRARGEDATIDYLNVGIQRYVLGVFMISYGVPKICGVFFDYQLSAVDSKMGAASDFELAWYFYGNKPWQELLSGVLELVPGFLLLHRRTYYLAAVLLLPVAAQVLVLNFFYEIGGLTFPAALVLMACNLYILYSQKPRIVAFVKSLNFDMSVAPSRLIALGRYAGWLLAVLVVLRTLYPQLAPSDERRAYEKLVGAYTLDSMTRNGVLLTPGDDSHYYRDLYIERQARWNLLRRFDGESEAFVLETDGEDFALLINEGGVGDADDEIDETTALRGTYRLDGDTLILAGTQQSDVLEIRYQRRDPKPKAWLW